MTKDKLIETIKAYSSDLSDEVIHDLYEFFNSNVVIPRGENRHQYADVLHEWIEGTEIEFESYHGGLLSFTKEIASTSMLNCKSYRIKQSEPVYEWQWNVNMNGVLFRTEKFLTEQEANKATHYVVKRIEETKRVRA